MAPMEAFYESAEYPYSGPRPEVIVVTVVRAVALALGLAPGLVLVPVYVPVVVIVLVNFVVPAARAALVVLAVVTVVPATVLPPILFLVFAVIRLLDVGLVVASPAFKEVTSKFPNLSLETPPSGTPFSSPTVASCCEIR